jgi:hypothetical protein
MMQVHFLSSAEEQLLQDGPIQGRSGVSFLVSPRKKEKHDAGQLDLSSGGCWRWSYRQCLTAYHATWSAPGRSAMQIASPDCTDS